MVKLAWSTCIDMLITRLQHRATIAICTTIARHTQELSTTKCNCLPNLSYRQQHGLGIRTPLHRGNPQCKLLSTVCSKGAVVDSE